LIELEEGKLSQKETPVVSSKFVRQLAEDAAQAHFAANRVYNGANKKEDKDDTFMTEYMLSLPRECIKNDPTNKFCELYQDGTRCLRTDDSHAFCGFFNPQANNNDDTVDNDNDEKSKKNKRHFSVVLISKLKK